MRPVSAASPSRSVLWGRRRVTKSSTLNAQVNTYKEAPQREVLTCAFNVEQKNLYTLTQRGLLALEHTAGDVEGTRSSLGARMEMGCIALENKHGSVRGDAL